MIEVQFSELALKVVSLVPLDHRVFNLTDATQIAVNLHNPVRVLMVPIFVVVENCFLSRLAKLRYEPLDAG